MLYGKMKGYTMKKLILISLLASFAYLANAGNCVTVTNESIKILPQAEIKNAQSWTSSTAYAQGRIVQWESRFFMAIVAGTSTNNYTLGPRALYGTVEDGNVIWYKMPNQYRIACFIQNLGTNDLYVTDEPPAEIGKGICVGPNRSILTFADEVQGPLYTIYDGTDEVNQITFGEMNTDVDRRKDR